MKSVFTLLAILFVFTFNSLAIPAGNKFQEEVEIIEKLDSIISYDYDNQAVKSKIIFKYDNKANLLEMSNYEKEDEILVGSYKEIMSYDYKSNIISLVEQEWNLNTNNWINDIKTEYQYDENENISEEIEYVWFKQNSNWIETSKIEFRYDEDNKPIQDISYNRNENEWVAEQKSEYSYDGNNLVSINSSEIAYDGEWEEVWKRVFEYDDNDNMTLYVLHLKLDSELSPVSMEEYFYDENNNLTETIVSYKYFSETWDLDNKTEYIYEGNNLIESIESNYDMSKDDWENVSKEVMEYDNNNYMTLLQTYQYDRDEEIWNSYEKEEYEYDEYGNILLNAHYSDDFEDGSWRFGMKNEYSIDYSNEWAKIGKPENFTDMFINKPIEGIRSFWADDEEVWNEYDKDILYYSDFITSVNQSESFSVILYPNPAKDKIRFAGLSEVVFIEIYSVSGEKLISKKILPGDAINISELSTGMYFYTLKNNKNKINGKFIK